MKNSKNRLSSVIKISDEIEESISDFADDSFTVARGRWRPLYDLFITKDKLVIVVEIPGVDKDEIALSISPRGVFLRGRRVASKLIKEGKIFYNIEILYGNFERRIPFPIDVQTKNVKVNLANGLLTLTFPLMSKHMEKVIPIEEG